MSVNNFIPELWSDRIHARMRKALVYGDLANRDYEGEFQGYGSRLKISGVGPVTISSYTPNVTTVTPEQLNDEAAYIEIDQRKYFAFKVDDVDQAQARGNLLSAGMDEAAYGLADVYDQFIAGKYTLASYITATTPVNSVNVHAFLQSLAQKLDELNVPRVGRWCVIPPWMNTKLVIAKLVVENTTNDAFNNGVVGRVAGFDLRMSNNVPVTSGTDYKVMAGTNRAISAASQLASVEAYRPESSFSDAIKGLSVYGADVVEPDCLVVGDASELAEP